MRIIQAYTEAGTSGKQGLAGKIAKAEPRARLSGQRESGDSVNLSPEALAMLANEDAESLNSGPDDGLYDQSGNLTRQFDNVQAELRKLASMFSRTRQNSQVRSELAAANAQLSSIRLEI